MKTKAAIILLMALAVSSCKTIHRSSDTKTELSVSPRPISVDYDTTIHLEGQQLQLNEEVRTGTNQVAQMEPKTVQQGRLSTTASIKDGQLYISTRLADTTLLLSGQAKGWAFDTTVRSSTVITQVQEPSLWAKIWTGIKSAYVLILSVLFVFTLLMLAYRYVKRQY